MSTAARMLAIAMAAALTACVITAAVYGGHAAVLLGATLVPVGLLTVGAAEWVRRTRSRLGSLRRQFLVVALVVAAQLMVVVVLLVAMMSIGSHDAFFTIVVAAYAGLLGAMVGAVISAGVLRDLESVRDGLTAVGAGERDVTFRTTGRDEIAELAVAAGAMEGQIADEERMRRELVASISHDLRTPITSLRLLADAVGDEIVDGATREEYLSRLRVHVRQLGVLIEDLFELSRLEAGELTLRMESVPLGDLVDETVEAMRADAAAGGIALAAEPGAEPAALVRANPEQLQRVLFNLLRNAIRHTPADGSVTVRTSAQGDHVEIEVADTGEGIPAADRDRVFEPFVQGMDPSRRHGGTGLGLAISRAIVEAHGGRIWLADAPRGTAVRVRLPAAT